MGQLHSRDEFESGRPPRKPRLAYRLVRKAAVDAAGNIVPRIEAD